MRVHRRTVCKAAVVNTFSGRIQSHVILDDETAFQFAFSNAL